MRLRNESSPRGVRDLPVVRFTEFGVHDVDSPVADSRAEWLKGVSKWWSETDPQSLDWNPLEQLKRIVILETREMKRKK